MPRYQPSSGRQELDTQGNVVTSGPAGTPGAYGSYQGYPVRRVLGPGGSTFEINFNGDWMSQEAFMDPFFQQAYVANRRTRGGGPVMGNRSRRRAGPPVRKGGGGGGGGTSDALLQALMSRSGG